MALKMTSKNWLLYYLFVLFIIDASFTTLNVLDNLILFYPELVLSFIVSFPFIPISNNELVLYIKKRIGT